MIQTKNILYFLLLIFLLLPISVCGKNKSISEPSIQGGKNMNIEIHSPTFHQNGMIPALYTCDDKNISPPLTWDSGPKGTRSFAILVDDPDAPVGIWVHWVIFNIPADKLSLAENIPPSPKLNDGTIQGINDFRRNGYGGPCPPNGTHRYFFKIYALDKFLRLDAKAKKNEVLNAMAKHVLAKGELIAKYKRK